MSIQLTDVNGNIVLVSCLELNRAMSKDLTTIYGLSLSEIGKLRRFYLDCGGKTPVTDKAVEEAIARVALKVVIK